MPNTGVCCRGAPNTDSVLPPRRDFDRLPTATHNEFTPRQLPVATRQRSALLEALRVKVKRFAATAGINGDSASSGHFGNYLDSSCHGAKRSRLR